MFYYYKEAPSLWRDHFLSFYVSLLARWPWGSSWRLHLPVRNVEQRNGRLTVSVVDVSEGLVAAEETSPLQLDHLPHLHRPQTCIANSKGLSS